MESAQVRTAAGRQPGGYDEDAQDSALSPPAFHQETLRAYLRSALGKTELDQDTLQRLRLALGDARPDAADPRVALGDAKPGLENLLFAVGRLDPDLEKRGLKAVGARNNVDWGNLHRLLKAVSVLQQNSGVTSKARQPQQPQVYVQDVLTSRQTGSRSTASLAPAKPPRMNLRNAGHAMMAGHRSHVQGQRDSAAQNTVKSPKEFQMVPPRIAANVSSEIEVRAHVRGVEHGYCTSSLSPDDRRRFGLDRDQVDDGKHAAVLSPEDRRRFGLDAEELQKKESACTSSKSSKSGSSREEPRTPAAVPKWSSLSAEDRRRFGLLNLEQGAAQAAVAAGTGVRGNLGREHASVDAGFCPDVLWGGHARSGIPGSGAARSAYAPAPSMARTLAQLEAVGMTRQLPGLRATEEQLFAIKLHG